MENDCQEYVNCFSFFGDFPKEDIKDLCQDLTDLVSYYRLKPEIITTNHLIGSKQKFVPYWEFVVMIVKNKEGTDLSEEMKKEIKYLEERLSRFDLTLKWLMSDIRTILSKGWLPFRIQNKS